MSEAIVMGLTRRLLPAGLFDLVDFISAASGVLVSLRFDGSSEVELEFGKSVVKGFTGQSFLRYFASMRGAFVHAVEHGFDQSGERLIAGRATETPLLLEIIRRETTLLATNPRNARRLRIQRRLQQQIRQRKSARISDALGLSAFFTQIDFVNLVIDDLSEMNRGRLGAEIAF